MAIDQKKVLRIGKRLTVFTILLLLLSGLLLSIAWHTLRSDHSFVLRKIKEIALEKYQADLQLAGYQLEWNKTKKLIQVQLRDLSIASTQYATHPVLQINHAASEFNPWDLITGNFQAHPVSLDSVWVHLYRDSLEQRNFSFGKDSKEKAPKKPGKITKDIEELPSISIGFLDFHREIVAENKWQRTQLSSVYVEPRRLANQNWVVNLQSQAHFDGLVFDPAEGGFLMNTDGVLNFNFSLADRGRTIVLQDSYLQVDEQKYLLAARFFRDVTNRLELEIENTGVTLTEVLPLLNTKINKALDVIQIDQPIHAHFSLNKLLEEGVKGVINLDFSTDAACVQYKTVNMTSVSLAGNYSNDCDKDGKVIPGVNCLILNQLDGDILDLLPTKMQGKLLNLGDPQVDMTGVMDIDFPRLNALLAPKDKITFTGGQSIVNFNYQGQLKNVLNAPFDEANIKLAGDAVFNDITLETNNPHAPSPSLSGQLSFDENHTLLEDLCLDWMGSKINLSGSLGNLPEFLFYDNEALITDFDLHLDQLDLNLFVGEKAQNTKNSKQQKEKYQNLERQIQKIARNVNGSLQLEIDKLIFDTLFLTDVKTQFRLYSPQLSEYLDSSMIHMEQLTAKVMGVAPIFVDLSLSQDEFTHLQVDVKMLEAAKLANILLSKQLKINDGEIVVDLKTEVPLRSLLESRYRLKDLRFDGLINLDQVEVEMDNIPWPVHKISGPFVFDRRRLQFKNLKFEYQNSPFFLHGLVDNYAYLYEGTGTKASVDLQLRGNFLDLRTPGKNTQSGKESSMSPTSLFRSLDTIYQLTDGFFDVRLDSVLTNNHTIFPMLLQAALSPDDLHNNQYQLRVDSFSFGLGPENTVSGHARVFNPEKPEIAADFQAKMTLRQMGKLLTSDYLELRDGYFNMDLKYHSPLYDTLDATHYLLEAKIDGEAELVNGSLFYNYRDFTFDDVFAHLSFDQRAVYIRDLDLKVNENRIIASGQSTDFFPFFILPDQRANIELKAFSPHFDFGKFTAPHGLGKDTLNFVLQNTSSSKLGNQKVKVPLVDSNTNNQMQQLQQTAGYIDQLLDRGSLEMTTEVTKLVYNKFYAENLKGGISLQPDTVQLNQLKMDVADGSFRINGLISDVVLHQPKVIVEVDLEGSDVREILRQFEDFGQTHVGYENVEGQVSAAVQFKADITSNYAIIPETMYGDMDVNLTGGQLIELQSLKKLTGFLFRDRRLNHVLLDTLTMYTHIRGSDLYVDKFYLHSSSVDFGAEGVYSLGTNNKTKILISLPVRNLFRRHITKEEMEQGDSERKGLSILIEARQKKERLRLRWKPFVFNKKKYRLIELEEE